MVVVPDRTTAPTPEMLEQVAVTEQFVRGLTDRDYARAYPGFPTQELLDMSSGQAREHAQRTIDAAPSPADYAATRANGGYTKRLTVIEAYVRPDHKILQHPLRGKPRGDACAVQAWVVRHRDRRRPRRSLSHMGSRSRVKV